jgi:hypothetical protein
LTSPAGAWTIENMADRASAFPLRLRDPRLRALVREVARQEGVSQNELIEHAIEDEMVMRGRLLAADLQAAASRLNQLSDEAYADVVARSIGEFAEGEARPEPLPSSALHSDSAQRPKNDTPQQSSGQDQIGVLAAFHAGRR